MPDQRKPGIMFREAAERDAQRRAPAVKRGRPKLADPMIHTAILLPQWLHAKLRVGATGRGRGMSDYIRGILAAANRGEPGMGPYVVLVGDIASGFKIYGPFTDGTDVVRWTHSPYGARLIARRHWVSMQLEQVYWSSHDTGA